ncbi:uncharacterized protein LOC142554594 [Primulina tabacum]|uniref:uncharacterized protein LOC142554594 n=1 Tax=Primulina tabacum TaxID=48773 RepID=UPI003F5A20CA
MVREEVGDKYFCILVDEARDISKREQIAIILSDTTSMNLKNEISNVLVHHDLHIKKIRAQGYDGASNMRGAWNGLQALFLKDCPYAYYVHCFAHRLQLTLISAAKDRIAELHTAQINEIEYMLSIGERDSGSGANQIGNLQRAGATCWSSHYDSVKSLIDKEIVALEYELIHYKLDVMQNLKISTFVELCQQLTESGRSNVYVIHLVLTLPVSTTTTERAFSAMKHVKTSLRNKWRTTFLPIV